MPKYINIIGIKFNRLLVLDRADDHIDTNNKKVAMFVCVCECGKKKNIAGVSLRHNRVTSCGCRKSEIDRARKIKPLGQASFNAIYNQYIREARERDLVFNLTKDHFKTLIDSNCEYCDKQPSNMFRSKYNTGDYYYNGIDRVDNNIGYLFNNCVPCCGWCNTMKRHYTVDEFKDHITRLYLNLTKTI